MHVSREKDIAYLHQLLEAPVSGKEVFIVLYEPGPDPNDFTRAFFHFFENKPFPVISFMQPKNILDVDALTSFHRTSIGRVQDADAILAPHQVANGTRINPILRWIQ